ncbi:hypothetical protein [Comamonas sp. JC664]|uniref:hypothetical protein n=1 Tax=Comamonas sp. JC664 TaxID=2801917 RepID=UPI0036092472
MQTAVPALHAPGGCGGGKQPLLSLCEDEATAAALDDESEEDVLVLAPQIDALELIEDELLMALPMVPMHEVCPVDVKAGVRHPGF